MSDSTKKLIRELIESVERDIGLIESHLDVMKAVQALDPKKPSRYQSSLQKCHLQYSVLLSVLKDEERVLQPFG
jgi:hypothetical protein